ncbi:MAG TPA: hypothetical protein VJU79_03245, partial [Candidatus Dormibacteraeota bacterium]|nr:hypothetical protein [Candidatus Dormibacteraeota bacterium]
SGALEVSAVDEDLGGPGTQYPFKKSKFLNLNGDDVITQGDPPSGAHSDIFHPHLAWVALRAAGLEGRVPA